MVAAAEDNRSLDDQYADTGGGSTSTQDVINATAVPASGDWALLAQFPDGVTPAKSVNLSLVSNSDTNGLDGTYEVLAVDGNNITLANPSTVNSNWGMIQQATPYGSPNLSTQGEAWIGPFVVNMPEATRLSANFVAEAGMYRVQGKTGKKLAQFVDVLVEYTPCDALGQATGDPQTATVRVYGDGTDQSAKGVTLAQELGFTGRVSCRARRLTNHDLGDDNDSVSDEVKWRDLYAVAPITNPQFGDVTTILTTTYATAGATSVKQRKLNCVATRKVLVRNPDNTFGPELAPSQEAADIICHMALDPRIGGRKLAELDVPNIYDTLAGVVAYFGVPEAGQFNYTFDQDGSSFEEMVQAVAQAVFCTAYRQASKLRLTFERATTDSMLLFNHRSKLPGSETRTVRFGNLGDNDGVQLDWVSPLDGTTRTVYVPTDQSAVKPKKLSVIGGQTERWAYLQAYRAYNKIKYQNTTTKFDALGQATQLVLTQLIEVTDNTRPDVFDGHVVSVNGLTVELSQPFQPVAGVSYSMYLQREDSVEVLPVQAGADNKHVVLLQAPATTLVVDPAVAMPLGYQITGDDGSETTGFLVTEKGAFDKSSLEVQAINYDPRYYANDHDYGGTD